MFLDLTFVEWVPRICILLIGEGVCFLTLGKILNRSEITDHEIDIFATFLISIGVGLLIYYILTVVWVV